MKIAVVGAIALASVISTPGRSDSFVGRGVRGSYVWVSCNRINCSAENTSNFLLYVGRQGHVFDYTAGQGANGNLMAIGKRKGNALVGVHGNTLTWTTFGSAGSVTQVWSIQGNTCSVSVRSGFTGVWYVIKSQTCELTSEHEE